MSSALTRLFVALLVAGAAVAAPRSSQDFAAVCTSPRIRRAWHTLNDEEKKAYIDAELCLMSTPATLGLRGTRTKFDEFQSVHVLKMEIAHWTGQFLPFHRLFVWAHEEALRNDCGFTGAQPYWAEELDVGAFSKSILLDPVRGFGGDGFGPDRCIRDGSFVNYTNTLGPGFEINDHCINRQVNDSLTMSAAATVIEGCMNMPTFLTLWSCLESRGGPHSAGHSGVGAQMGNPISSPGDPLFYLHHAWLDRIWNKWQLKDPEVRNKDMEGNNRADLSSRVPAPGVTPINLTRPADIPEPLIVGDPGNVTTLNHLLYTYGLVENRTIGEVMDTSKVLCYSYD
ncbi:hypothetical protein B0T14DRAFT_422288 [Immersiella caudata]|uniref:Tyrosinase copper-binding domain-containing protein n=1 Tax=Immersiella caudata TaxID=314043 RepID=A0AA39X664_9PEZI|nr:hypothetical protein B0T14DRAFT_422288 [Immersiella caudata]